MDSTIAQTATAPSAADELSAKLAYRDAGPVQRARVEEAAARLRARIESDEVRVVFARRCARIGAGAVGLLGAAALIFAAAWGAITHDGGGIMHAVNDTTLVRALLGSSVAAFFVWPVAWIAGELVARRVLRRAADALAREPGDPIEIERTLRSPDALHTLLARAGVGDALSVAVPLAALCLLAPLTLHWLFVLVVSNTARYGDWILTSMALVGHSHVVLACLAVRYARSLGREASLAGKGASDGWGALGWTMLSSAVPGAVLLAVPVALVGVTGAVFVPAAWAWAAARLRNERKSLAA